MSDIAAGSGTNTRTFMMIAGVAMLLAGLAGHLVAAAAIANRYTTTYIAYRDHVSGFVLGTLVTGVLVGLLGRKFWRGRPELSLLIVGALQLAFGIFVYFMRFAIVGVH